MAQIDLYGEYPLALTIFPSKFGRMSSSALPPMVPWRLSNVLAAAARTSGSGSISARRTVGMRESTYWITWSGRRTKRLSK